MRNAFGVLVFTPVLLVWFGNPLPRLKPGNSIEGIGIFLAVLGLSAILLFGNLASHTANSISFLIIPLLIWASIRVKTHGSLIINLFFSLVILWGISHNQGVLFNAGGSQISTYDCVICTMQITSLIISASMEKLRASQKSLSYISSHDSLTGLYNRLFFETEFKRLDNSRRFPISIIMADIDELKMMNDRFGHETGDLILKNVAELFSSTFRQEDIISRYGGDEFVVILPDTSSNVVKKIMKRINSRIKEYNETHADLPIRISMGVSTANQGESLQGHLKNADALMYKKKQKRKRKSL